MSIDDWGRNAGRSTLASFEALTDVEHDLDELVGRRRAQQRRRTAALVAAVGVAACAVLMLQGHPSAPSNPEPMQPAPGLDIPDVPVWYDSAGLHRGDVVEEASVDLRDQDGSTDSGVDGALALVRTGAVYLDPSTGDVWFQPWGSEPFVVGHNSKEGPGADPNGDIAAWFEGSELVVYDTATFTEVSRTEEPQPVDDCQFLCAEHMQGNRFLLVTDKRIAWAAAPSGETTYSLDLATLETQGAPPNLDVPLEVPSDGDAPNRLEVGRLSSNRNYVLGVEPGRAHLAVIVNTTTGRTWEIPNSHDPTVAWSYGNTALIYPEGSGRELLTCNASALTCTSQTVTPPILMPTN